MLAFGRVSAAARSSRWIPLLAVAVAALAADQVSKALVRTQVELGGTASLFGPFEIRHVRNSGIVHGLLQGSALPLGLVTLLVVALIVAYVARYGGRHPFSALGFGLLVGGSVGNLVDRLRLGYVTDFLSRDSGGAFNLADLSILLGLAVLLLGSLTRPAPRSISAKAAAADP